MSEKPTSVRLDKNVKEKLELYMKKENMKKSEAINALIMAGLNNKVDEKEGFFNMGAILNREYELGNMIQMKAFLEMKKWEAKEYNGFAFIKLEEIQRMDEFISCFSDLAHNSNMWAERLRNEGYTMFADIIEESKAFL